MKNVAVFFGGKSCEREISIITGVFVLNCLDKTKYNPIPVYVDGDGRFFTGEKLFNLQFYRAIERKYLSECTFLAGEKQLYLLKRKKLIAQGEVYMGINCTHGANGENGGLAGFMQTNSITFLTAGIFAESFSIDKDFTKLVLNSLEIKTVDYVRLKRSYFFEKSDICISYLEKKLQYPIIVKPARLGSSIGIERANDKEQLFTALSKAFCYDDKVVCEKYMIGAIDINCAVYGLNDKVYLSKIEQTVTANDLLTFEDKYGGGKLGSLIKQNCEAQLSEQNRATIYSACEKVYRRCDFNSIVRFDFLLCENQVYLNEINAIPGSLAYYLFCDKIGDFSKLLNQLIEDCVQRERKRKNLISTFKSNVLNGDWSGIKK